VTTKVGIATPLESSLRDLIADVDPDIEVLCDPTLLPEQRFPGDHDGDPSFQRTPEQQAAFRALIDSADILYGIPDTNPRLLTETVRANPRLRWVHTMAAGGGAQVKAAGLTPEELERVTFTTSAGVHGLPLAEFALFGVLAGAKDLPRLRLQQDRREWTGRWTMKQVHEQTVLVVGLGGIGKQTARLLKALGAHVIGTKRRAEPVANVDEVYATDALPELVARADAIVFTLPGTTETTGLYGSALIKATKKGAVVVNVGRGTVIDEPALIEALQTGHLSAVFLDVTAVEPLPSDSPLWGMPEVVIAPHTAALNPGEDRRIAELFVTNLKHWLKNERLLNVVDTHRFY
jgi:phosphoglycerate dehydrogenase-like enzyme